MAKATSYLHFGGKCEEAFSFYKECLGGELEMDKVGDTPMADNMPTDQHDKVLHVALTSGDLVVMGSDMVAGDEVTSGTMHSIVITAPEVGELRELYAKLVVGGTPDHEITEEYFGTYGDLTDKYGVHWMFQSDAKE